MAALLSLALACGPGTAKAAHASDQAPEAQKTCGPVSAAAGLSSAPSHWREFSEQGQRLVREQGTLAGANAELAFACAGWTAVLQLHQARGSRHYLGQTTTGAPLQTRSQVRLQHLGLLASHPLGEGRGRAAWLGLRQSRQARDIGDTAQALGYPERFVSWQFLAGASQAWSPAPAHSLRLLALAQAGPRGRLDLTLPGMDPARLSLGRSRGWLLAAEWSGPLAMGALTGRGDENGAARWTVGLQYERLAWAAGPPQAITRNGLPAAGARQPRSVLEGLGLQLLLNWPLGWP